VPTDNQARILLMEAMQYKIGCAIHTAKPEIMKVRLERSARKHGISVTVVVPVTAPTTEVWIIHRAKETRPSDREEDAEPVPG
jgi:hypothetical protein